MLVYVPGSDESRGPLTDPVITDLADFKLEEAEVAAIDALDTGVRGGPDPEQLNRETHPKVVDNS